MYLILAPTHSRTGVAALVIDTGFIARTLRVYYALGLALHIGISYIVSNTPTRCCPSILRTFGIGATWRRVAWLNYFDRSGRR